MQPTHSIWTDRVRNERRITGRNEIGSKMPVQIRMDLFIPGVFEPPAN